MQLGAALAQATERLAASSDSPRLDAEVLVAHATGRSRGSLFAYDRDELPEPVRLRLLELVEARSRRVPVAYLTGEKEFWSLNLRVTPDVLVPRPETELLVEWGLELLRGREAPSVLDLGTGSGAIALALARERADVRVTATDASAAALGVARDNALRLGLERVRFAAGSWWDAVDAHARYDLVVSNPPYIAADDPHLPALAAEPRSALTEESDGLAALRRIVAGAAAHLAPGAWLLLEHGHEQGAAVRALLQQAGLAEVQTRHDLAGRERASGARRA